MTQGEVIARGLEFPEGPVWNGDHLICTEVVGGFVSRWAEGAGETVERIAPTGGGPNGATLGPDGALYVTQNGGMFAEGRVPAGILRVSLEDGSSDYAATEIAGVQLDGPNDLAFGPDGRLWFTDPRGAADPAQNLRSGSDLRPRHRAWRGRAHPRARAGVPQRDRLPRRWITRLDGVVQPPRDATGAAGRPSFSSSCPSATPRMASASAPTARSTLRRPTRTQ